MNYSVRHITTHDGFKALHKYYSASYDPGHADSNTLRLFKNGIRPALKHYFYKLLDFTKATVQTPHAVIAVPSSNKNKVNSITKIAKALPLKNKLLTDATDAVIKTKSTVSFCRSKQRNAEALKQSFQLKTELITGKDILLVDDVTTTGTTFHIMIELLLEAGANSVTPVALAYTPKLR